jgi:hypothetical protein
VLAFAILPVKVRHVDDDTAGTTGDRLLKDEKSEALAP